MVAFLASETQLARSGELMVGPAPGVGRPVTVAELFEQALRQLPVFSLRLLPFALLFFAVALGVRYLARNPVDVDRARAMALAFGWVPGLFITLMFAGGLYVAIPMLHAALALCFTVSVWPQAWVRPLEFLGATAVGAVWFFIG